MCLVSIIPDLKYYYLSLSKIPSIGPITGKNLIKYAGSVEDVFNMSPREINEVPFLKSNQKNALINKTYLNLVEEEINRIERERIEVITIESEKYPYRLRLIEDSPLVIYAKGNISLNPLRTVGIVGTRTSSITGQRYTQKIIEELLPYQATIVSGLASGIDGYAHQYALNNSLNTIGVVAHGFKYRYPESNAHLFNSVQKDGIIITEYGYNVYASKDNFPRRNRIVAALSDAIVVVESKERGGSLITANIANDYNKDVFAIPGRLGDSNFAGCNHLIKSHKAHLFQCADDIAYILRWSKPNKADTGLQQGLLFEKLNESEKKIVNYLRVNYSASFDDLAFHCSIDLSNLASVLLQMEFKNLVLSLPGNKFTLNR